MTYNVLYAIKPIQTKQNKIKAIKMFPEWLYNIFFNVTDSSRGNFFIDTIILAQGLLKIVHTFILDYQL